MARSKRFIEQSDENRSEKTNTEQHAQRKRGLITNAPFVRVRKSPNKNSQGLAVLERGDEVTIIDFVDGYHKILFAHDKKPQDDQIGYVSALYIELMEDV